MGTRGPIEAVVTPSLVAPLGTLSLGSAGAVVVPVGPSSVQDPGPCATPSECLQWYTLNATCERSGHVWLQDDRRRWESCPPLIVEVEYDGHRYVSGRYGRLERRAAWCLSQLVNRDLIPAYDRPSEVTSTGIDLGETQISALWISGNAPASCVTGGPGTGKTMIARLLAQAHKRVLGLSPTGKGADRLGESIGTQCYTIHRADRLIRAGKLDLSQYDLIECDETGMLDCETFEMLCAQLHNNKTWARIVFLGDPGQLPSIGPGRVLDELIAVLPTTHLDIVYRYSDADIGTACEHARNGRLYIAPGTPTYAIREGTIDEAKSEYRRMVGLYGSGESRLITHQRIHSNSFNYAMKYIYRTNPPIVCLKNNYRHNVFNGQCGYADYVGSSRITFGDRHLHKSDVQWAYAYGSTCHRAQGGQWDGVVVWIPSARYLTREWLLTACSRAVKSLSIIVRDADTTERCLAASKPASRRVSLLSAFLSGKAQWV